MITARRAAEIAYEAHLIAAELAAVLISLAACRVIGHKKPLRRQAMAIGSIGVCNRCGTTVEPIASPHPRVAGEPAAYYFDPSELGATTTSAADENW